MQALVIGGSGFLGTPVTERLLAAGHRVAVLSRGERPIAHGAQLLKGDRKSVDSFTAAIADRGSFDLVVDITAMTAPDLERVLPPLRDRVGHYVMISTDFVYATDIETLPIREDAPKDSVSGYAKGKLACEAILAESPELDGRWSVLRPPHIMGAGKELGSGSVQGRDKNLLRSMRAGTGLTLIGEGDLLIQPVWHRQIAAAIADIALKPAAFGKAMNMMGPEIVTTREYYRLIADELGVPLNYDSIPTETYRRDFPDKRSFARHRIYDLSALRAAGHSPQPGLRDAIRETVQWMDANC